MSTNRRAGVRRRLTGRSFWIRHMNREAGTGCRIGTFGVFGLYE